jgi:4'-phosphopantetheinyl transferase
MVYPPAGEKALTDEFHVWTALTDDFGSDEALARLRAVLSSDEVARASRFVHECDGRTYVIAHGLLRFILNRYIPLAPIEWRFVLGRWGRPEVADLPAGQRLRFNLSHTDGLAAFVVSREADCGVDAERIGAPPRDVYETVLSPEELAVISSVAPHEQAERFFTYWTLKEAYAKARGLGLGIGARDVSFECEPPSPPRARFGAAVGDDPSRWQFQTARLHDRFIVSTAVAGDRGSTGASGVVLRARPEMFW